VRTRKGQQGKQMAGVTLKDVVKVYEGGVKVVDRFNLEIKDREFVVLVGPSGCGKSTTLRLIAGLEEITSGTIQIGERIVNDVPPKDRDIAMVFQSYALYPHMSVYENMAFGLKLRKVPKNQIDEKVKRASKILGIEHLLERKPKALSVRSSATRSASCSTSRSRTSTPSSASRCVPKSNRFT
jgi:multiple sugar transport system ATP-binding protein